MKTYCFFIYTKSRKDNSIKSFKATIKTDKGKSFAKVLAIREYGKDDIIKIEDPDILTF